MSDGPAIDVLIICALKDELDALLQVRDGVIDAWQPVAGNPPYHTATIEGRAGPIRVAAARQTKPAGVDSAIVASTLGERLKPGCVAMCGVCAGHPDDTDLADVVIADRVFQHDLGKLKDTGFEGDIWTHILNDRWLHVAQDLAGKATNSHGYGEPDDEAAGWWFLERLVDGRNPQTSGYARYFRDEQGTALLDQLEERGHIEWTDAWTLTEAGRAAVNKRRARLKGTEVKARPYHIHVAPMGSGNYVAADGKDWERLGTSGMRKLLAIEQEAASVGEVAHKRRVPFIIAKGVMDHANPYKNDGFKNFAARASAEILCEFLRRVIEPSVDSATARPEHPATFEGPTPDPRFTGRTEELAELERLILANRSVCVVAAGIGGIGKTTLVSEFVATRARELCPDGVAWIDGSPERLISELARVSNRFGWPREARGRDATPEEAVQWLKSALAPRRALIVVDNFDAERSNQEYVPIPGGDSRTIVTSRSLALDDRLNAKRLKLPLWTIEICRAYLREHCLGCRWMASATDDQLDQLAEFVGRLPLGMRLLVSVLRNRAGTPQNEILRELREKPLGTLDKYEANRGVAATFGWGYDNLPEPERSVLQALAACARQTRAEIVAAVAEVVEVAEVRASLDYLHVHGFADLHEDGRWGLHDVVRLFVLKQPGNEGFAARQLRWVIAHLGAHAGPTAWRDFADGIEEAKHAVVSLLGSDVRAAIAVYGPTELHLSQVGHYSDAIELSKALFAAASPDSQEAVIALNNMGLCYLTLGEAAKAIELHTHALAIEEKLENLEGQAIQFGNLGQCYWTLDELAKAIEYHTRAQVIDEKLGNLEGEASDLGNLGLCYLKLDEVAKAIEHLELVLAIHEELGNPEGRAAGFNNLGLCYQKLDEVAKAIEYHARALAIHEELGSLLGQATGLSNLGLCYWMLDDVTKALEFHTFALIIEEKLGRLLDQALQLGYLGRCYRRLSEVAKAIEHFERALAIHEKLGGLEGQALQLGNLGLCYEQLGDGKRARGYLVRARDLFQQMGLADDHPHMMLAQEAIVDVASADFASDELSRRPRCEPR